MIFETAKKIICKRLGDPDLKMYRDIVGGFLIESICELSVLPETNYEEIKGLAVNEAVTINGDLDLSGYSMLKLLDIYRRVYAGTRKRFTELSQDMFSLIGKDKQVVPDEGEIFWCNYYNLVRFYKSAEANGMRIYLLYIKEPDDYIDSIELNTIMSIGFQYRVISLAVTKIKQHLGVTDDNSGNKA